MNKLWTFGDSFTAGHGCKYELTGTFSKENVNAYYAKTYKSYIDINKKIWPEIVSDRFDLQLINKSKNGMTTESISDSCLKFITKINEDDVVILQTSTIGRYDFPFLKEKTLMGYDASRYIKDDELFNISISPYFFKTIFTTNVENEFTDGVKNVLQYNNAQESLQNKNVILNKQNYDTIRNFFAEYISTGKYYERSVWRILQLSNILKSFGVNVYIINEDIWPIYLDKPSNLIEMHPNGIIGYVGQNKKTIFYDTKGSIDDSHPSYDGHILIADSIIKFIENENINIHNA
jgi:hypothetical protein